MQRRGILLASLPCLFASVLTLPLAADDQEDRDATLLFNTASRYYRQENWREAANSFEEYLKKFPRHKDAAEARFAAGYSWNRVGEHAAAIELLRLAARDEGTSWAADASFHLGRSQEALAGEAKGDAAERSRRLEAASESYGKASVLYSKLAEAPVPEGEKDARKRNWDMSILARSSQGEALYQAGKSGEAARALAPFLEEKEKLAGSQYYHRGLYLLGLSRQAVAKASDASGPRFAEARAALAAAAEDRFQGEKLWEEAAFLLARLAHQDGDLPKAAETYARVIAKGGDRAPQALYYRGLALYESQRPEDLGEARAELTRFLRDYPKHELAGKVRFYSALSAFDSKDYAGSEGVFRVVAEESPDLAGRALLRRGQCLLLKAEPNAALAAEVLGKAVESLEKEAASKPDAALLERLAEAFYWKGEAHAALSSGPGGASQAQEAAVAYGQVHGRFAREAPDLAEKALYQRARILHLAGKHAECAEASDLYRKSYPAGKGQYHAECLLLSAECAFHGQAGALPEAFRREAPRFYREAAAALKDPAEARRARYMAGVSLYFLGEYHEAGEALGAVREELKADPKALAAFPELPFYWADSLAQEPRKPTASPEDRERWKKAVAGYGEYLSKSKDGSHVPNALVNLGLTEEWLEDHEAAKKTFERFIETFPSHELVSQVRFELGNTKLVLGDLKGAAESYAEAAQSAEAKNPSLAARSLYQKAMIERRLGVSTGAAETLAGLLARHEAALKGDDSSAKLLRDARYQRAVALLEAGKGEEAQAELASFLEKDAGSPQEGEARNQLARSLLDAGKPADALGVLKSTLDGGASAQGRDQALYLAAWCHSALATGKDAAAQQAEMEATYRKLIAEHPQSPLATDAMLELGQHLFNRKAFAEAKKWLGNVREALESDAVPVQPASAARQAETLERSLFGLGFIAFEEADYPEAAKLLDRVAANQQSALWARAAFQAGRAYMKAGDPAHAAERFESVADAKQKAGDIHEESLLRLGECLHQLKKYPEAVKAIDRLIAEYPNGTLRHEARFARGFALQFSGDLDGAVESYRAVVSGTRAPVAARAQYHIGECRVEQGRHREAAKEFSITVANFDFDGEYAEWLRRSLLAAGIAFQAAGDTQAAQTQLKELVDRFSGSDEAKAASERLKQLGGKG